MAKKTIRTKRASYREGVEYVAWNDDPGSSDALDTEAVGGYISVQMLAALFGKDADKVATDVVEYRKKHGIGPENRNKE